MYERLFVKLASAKQQIRINQYNDLFTQSLY